jgi:hypothetical protein
MGCDIHSYVQVKRGDYWDGVEFHPFRDRNYGAFGFLAGVRNYSAVPPIAEPRGLPNELAYMIQHHAKDWKDDAHNHSWLSVRELTEFDYEAEVEDRRYTRQEAPGFFNGGATCEPGSGNRMTWREFLGASFMRDVAMLRAMDEPDAQVVFWFDN